MKKITEWMRFFAVLWVASAQPNIVYVVTDDQDQMLGASFPKTTDATPMRQTEELLVKGGVTFSNFFIHVPICNPSRSTTLTGRYLHNLKTTNTIWAVMHSAEIKFRDDFIFYFLSWSVSAFSKL